MFGDLTKKKLLPFPNFWSVYRYRTGGGPRELIQDLFQVQSMTQTKDTIVWYNTEEMRMQKVAEKLKAELVLAKESEEHTTADILQECIDKLEGKNKEDYSQLKTAVQDLLCELRISPDILKVMAKGYSPDYSGAPIEPGVTVTGEPKSFDNVVQLSQVVAQKLIEEGL